MKIQGTLACLLSAVLMGTSLPPTDAIAADTQAIVTFDAISPSVNGGEPIRGVDISSVLAIEDAGVVFHDNDGDQADIFKILADHGVNYIRVRVWNQPNDGHGHSYGGGNNDVAAAAEIGRRAAQYGMKLLVDFHYSDFWADPEKQKAPKEWSNYSYAEKGSAIYFYTLDSLKTIRDAGADIGMVQIGNETNGVFCGENDMYKICEMFTAGCNAVRDFDSSVLRVLHFANPSCGYYDWYAQVLNECNVDYDVFATSYYPYWHGTADNMASVLKGIATTYNKYVMVAETAYPYTNEDGDTFGNVVSKDSSDVTFRYEISVEGQAECLTDVFRSVAGIGEKGIGVFYWEPAWLGKSGLSWQDQSKLWESKGSGWATSYAGEYDSSVTSSGGSSYDNQALFDFEGYPLDSLDVYSRIYPQAYRYHPEDEAALPDGIYTIKNAGSGLYLNADDTGNAVQNEQSAQWHLKRMKGGYTLTCMSSGAYLTVRNGDGSHSSICLAAQTKEKDQLFSLVQSDGTYLLLTKESGLTQCVDVFDRSTAAGAWMTYNKPLMTKSQRFELTLIEADTTEPVTEPAKPTEPETQQPDGYKKGDIHADGLVDLTDLVLLQKHLLGLHPIDETQFQAADINNNGTVDVFDLGLLKRLILRK